jgi:hypothetical protein
LKVEQISLGEWLDRKHQVHHEELEVGRVAEQIEGRFGAVTLQLR